LIAAARARDRSIKALELCRHAAYLGIVVLAHGATTTPVDTALGLGIAALPYLPTRHRRSYKWHGFLLAFLALPLPFLLAHRLVGAV
jgi:hypothetical protein